MPEPKELTDQIQSAVKTLHDSADTYREEAKKFSTATAETKQFIDKVNADIDGLKTRLDATDLKVERKDLVKPGSTGVSDDVKAAQKKAFLNFMRLSKGMVLDPESRKALVEDATGQILVPPDIDAAITRALPAIAAIRRLAGTYNTTSDRVLRRSLTEVSMGWGKLENGAVVPETTPVPTEAYMYVEDLNGLAKLGKDVRMDSDAALEAFLIDSFSQKRGETEDNGFTVGTGHSNEQPAGVAVDATIIASYKDNLTTADKIVAEDMLTCEYGLPDQYLPGAAWLMARKTELALRLVRAGGSTTTDGPFLWQPGLQAGMPNNFDNFPIYNQSQMHYPADAVAGVVAVFGNFKVGYRIIDRMGMTIQRLEELYAEAGLVGYLASFRVGGGVLIPSAFRALYNNT